jgi:tetratricopeptide (TPR) repeat protein
LKDTHTFVRIESCILTAIAKVDEVGRGVIKKTVRIRLDLEVLNQPETLALKNPDMAIETGYIEFVKVTAQEERVLSVLESRQTLDHFAARQVHNFQGIVCHCGYKQALFFQVHAHVIEPPCDANYAIARLKESLWAGSYVGVMGIDKRSGNVHWLHSKRLADCGFMRWMSSDYAEARRNLIESRVIQFDTLKEDPYLSSPDIFGQHIVLPINLLFLGEWGEALREFKDVIGKLDKNALYNWAQVVHLNRAWLHLQAMDFAGVLAICDSVLPLVRDPALRPAPDDPTPLPSAFRHRLILTGSAETGLGNYESALEHLLAARAFVDRLAIIFNWFWRMRLESALTELWLAKGDLAQARTQAESFLKTALATAEHTWQALAWEVNARVAMAELDLTRAQDCIAKGLSAMEGFEVPLAAWRVHATAAEIYRRMKSRELAESQLVLSRETIMKLANSLPAEEPLRHIFLSAPKIRKILGERETPYLRTKEA